jgi:hypothetical protein
LQLATLTQAALTAIALPFFKIEEALLMRFKQQRHTAQERTGGKAAVCLATGVRVSCKRIKNAFKATVTLT